MVWNLACDSCSASLAWWLAVMSWCMPTTRLARPSGGYFLWVELPRGVDTLAVHRLALDQGISIAPGPIFSAKREYGHCLRLNYGHPWTPATEKAVAVLGQIIDSLLPREGR